MLSPYEKDKLEKHEQAERERAAARREALAAYAHAAWAGWMKYMFEHGDYDSGYWTMPVALNDRWRRQMNTSYADLPESEKESDRAEADAILAIIGGI